VNRRQPLLHGLAEHRPGSRLALIRYHSRRTGRVYELPVQYVRIGDRIRILVPSCASQLPLAATNCNPDCRSTS